MKLFVEHSRRARWLARPSQGFTLVEIMFSATAMAVFILGGLIAVHMMGLREVQLLESKAGASDSARRNIIKLSEDIYAAKNWQIGSWNGSSFTATASGVSQQGTALIIYPLILTSNQIVDMSKYFVYYFDASAVASKNGLLKYYNSTNGVAQICVSNLIDPLYFTCEDYRGVTQSNRASKSVIHATFQYAQFQYPLTQVSSNSLFDTYRIDIRATPHLPDGP
jgi:hypothetical protein